MTDNWILYQTTNLLNSKIYVGVHKVKNTSISRRYLGSGEALKPAIEKHGRENFVRVTLAEFICAEDAYSAEEKIVTEEFIKRKDTYNMKMGGKGCRGRLHSEETKERLRATNTGQKRSAETRAKISAIAKSRVLSDETKAKISAANKGKVLSEEHKAKIGAKSKGRIASEETRAKLRATSKGNKNYLGKKLSQEHKNKISENNGHKTHLIVNKVYYTSLRQAAESEEVTYGAIKSRLRSPKPKWSEWRYATEEEISNHLM